MALPVLGNFETRIQQARAPGDDVTAAPCKPSEAIERQRGITFARRIDRASNFDGDACESEEKDANSALFEGLVERKTQAEHIAVQRDRRIVLLRNHNRVVEALAGIARAIRTRRARRSFHHLQRNPSGRLRGERQSGAVPHRADPSQCKEVAQLVQRIGSEYERSYALSEFAGEGTVLSLDELKPGGSQLHAAVRRAQAVAEQLFVVTDGLLHIKGADADMIERSQHRDTIAHTLRYASPAMRLRPACRTRHLIASACTALALLTSCGKDAPASPSLLLITTSGLRADALPCYGGESKADSAICGLADRGALFVWAFTTTPAIAPSAATLLTSQNPDKHGVGVSAATFLRTGTTTLAGALQEHDYATAAFIATPELNHSRNLQLGFDLYETGSVESLAHSANRVAARATRWIERARTHDRPFFAWVHFPATTLETTPPLSGVGLMELDGYVRELIDAARNQDNGASISPGIGFAALAGSEAGPRSRPLDLERIRVPVIWSPPGGIVPQRFLAPVPLLDMAPTLLHSTGLMVPEEFEGEGLQVGPLPPTAPRPARPLELAAGNEIGLVLSRRYYARRLDKASARTALLSNRGKLPTAQSVSPQANEVADHELLLTSRHVGKPL